MLFALPWLDTSKVRSGRFRPYFKPFYWLFILTVIGLGWLGAQPAEGAYVVASRMATFYYFTYFLLVLPLLGKFEKTMPLPESIESYVNAKK